MIFRLKLASVIWCCQSLPPESLILVDFLRPQNLLEPVKSLDRGNRTNNFLRFEQRSRNQII